MPAELGGLSAGSLYVDTENSPVAGRLLSLATAAADHCHRVARSTDDETARRAGDQFTADTALRRVRILRAATASDLLLLPSILSGLMEREGLRVVCVDSVAAPWRGAEAGPRRAQELQWLAAELRRLARRHAATVVLTNHATTLLEPTGASSIAGTAASLVPALGASWQHCAAVRLWLEIRGEARVARLLKHPERPDGEAAFQILEVGIRDVCGADVGDGVGEIGEDSEEDDGADDDSRGPEINPGCSGDPGASTVGVACGGGGTSHVTKQKGNPAGHVTKQDGSLIGHVTKQEGNPAGHVTKQEAGITDGVQSKRRRVL